MLCAIFIAFLRHEIVHEGLNALGVVVFHLAGQLPHYEQQSILHCLHNSRNMLFLPHRGIGVSGMDVRPDAHASLVTLLDLQLGCELPHHIVEPVH